MTHENLGNRGEQLNDEVERPDGERWLEVLGEADLIGTKIPYFKDGRQLQAEEFTLIYDEAKYRERVLPFFLALENMPLDDPEREEYIEALRNMLHSYLDKPVKRS